MFLPCRAPGLGHRMQSVDVTQRVWDRLLSAKREESGLCCDEWTPQEAQALALYGPLTVRAPDMQVIAQIGQSLDGRVATEAGDARDVSGQDGLLHLHRLRALADAVVIGVRTALHDDPQLTVRLTNGGNPARVVIDPDGRLPNDARLLQDTSARRVIVQSVDKTRPAGVDVITLPRAPWIAPAEILAALGGLGLKHILIEGGGITIAQFLEARLLNRLHVAVAPLLIGSGPQSLTTSPVGTLSQALRPPTKVYSLGTDILFDCAFDDCAPPSEECA